MRRSPYLAYTKARLRRQILTFGGLDWSEGYREGALCESKNLSPARFPCLSQRAGRQLIRTFDSPSALYARGELCVVDGTDFLYDGIKEGEVLPGEKHFATLQNKVLIFPDKLCFDTETGVLSALEASYTVLAGKAAFTASSLTVDEGQDLFTDTFRAGDAIEISGCISHPGNNGRRIIRAVDGRTLTFDEDSLEAGSEGGALTLEREVPDLECVCESDGRLWGAAGSTIYASALGDPRNFFVYDGLSTDSYAVAVGSEGAFTGCCAYGGAVLFWKEDRVHKVVGGYPAQYELYSYQIPGVQAGCGGSLCSIEETLFYKGRVGFYAYNGGTPELISACFGPRRFSDAVAGSDGTCYYVSMRDETGAWGLYVFDPRRGIWLQEDGTHALGFAALEGALYCLDAESGKLFLTGQDWDEEGRVPWCATFRPFHEQDHGRKGYLRLYLRVELSAGAWLRVEASEDGGPFHQVWATHDDRHGTFVIPLRPGRCDKLALRLEGKGGCKVESLVREFYLGSAYR